MNSVVVAVSLMLVLSLFRVNVVIALILSALVAGLMGGLSLIDSINAFNSGLGAGAGIALSYALLGAFAAALSQTGITGLLSNKLILALGKTPTANNSQLVRWALLAALLAMSIASQNLLPIHIAFIPILVPPILHLMSRLQIDRRLVACVLTFGLVATYMILPVGFGGIFLNDILLTNLNINGLNADFSQVPKAMLLPAIGMLLGLFIALFFSYKEPRVYQLREKEQSTESIQLSTWPVVVSVIAILSTLAMQLYTESMIFGALIGFVILSASGILEQRSDQDLFTQGVKMMASIGFIMIAAAGFAEVINATGEVENLILSLQSMLGGNKGMAAFFMLFVGLLITLGIGSSFSTIPIIATIYVPLALSFGFSVSATIAIVGTAAALGDAGSPASDSTLGPTAGLNADGQHDHIRDSVLPTFIHFNLPLLVFGWIAAMIL